MADGDHKKKASSSSSSSSPQHQDDDDTLSPHVISAWPSPRSKIANMELCDVEGCNSDCDLARDDDVFKLSSMSLSSKDGVGRSLSEDQSGNGMKDSFLRSFCCSTRDDDLGESRMTCFVGDLLLLQGSPLTKYPNSSKLLLLLFALAVVVVVVVPGGGGGDGKKGVASFVLSSPSSTSSSSSSSNSTCIPDGEGKRGSSRRRLRLAATARRLRGVSNTLGSGGVVRSE